MSLGADWLYFEVFYSHLIIHSFIHSRTHGPQQSHSFLGRGWLHGVPRCTLATPLSPVSAPAASDDTSVSCDHRRTSCIASRILTCERPVMHNSAPVTASGSHHVRKVLLSMSSGGADSCAPAVPGSAALVVCVL